ncbi:MAG: MmgE/PrpD family protein [Clostridiales bacterium]|nr:MmgE/PrpD family protein [Clostridiales bacterium]
MTRTTKEFVDFIAEFMRSELPDRVVEKARLCVLDYLGCAYVGYGMNKGRVAALMEAMGMGSSGDIKVLGGDRAANAQTAALVNGMNAHTAELDDGHRFAAVHPGAVVISALLSSCGGGKVSGNDFLRGVVAGYETTIRLGEAIQPSHKLRGGHATGTCGTVGAAMAVAVAEGFDFEQTKGAVAAACTSASGLLEMIDDSSQLKPYNAGLAAMNGYVSAMMGQAGFCGPDDSLGGERGFLNFMADEYDADALTAPCDVYKIEQAYVKPYAACRHSHPAIEGALGLASEHSIIPDDIASIDIHTYKLAIPGHDSTNISSAEAAKMSTPFSVATAIANQSAGIEAFREDKVADRAILELASKVRMSECKEMTAASPAVRAAEIVVSLHNGKRLSKRVDHPLGEPENPMSEEMIVEKFRSLAGSAEICEERVATIIAATMSMDMDLANWYKAI